ncbi:MAG: ribonuclease P protein component [Alphaproteobacteria bacterium]|nr:ribonuclease P protein component [Alphaproteobacteria bacterium]
MTGQAIQIETIKGRANFVRMNTHASRFVVSNFILQMIEVPDMPEGQVRIGYTVTKKLGNAVVRNRIKRRLREAARKTIPTHAKTGRSYVFIARHKALSCDFAELVRDMEFAFSRIRHPGAGRDPRQPTD